MGAVLLVAGGQIEKNFPSRVVAPAQAAAPAPTPVAETPAAEPVAKAPIAEETTSSGMKPVQNIAVIAGRNQDDQEIAESFSKLTSVCPEQGSKLADILVNAQTVVKNETGTEPEMLDLMQGLYTAQEGPAADGGVSCLDSVTGLTLLMTSRQ